MDDFFNHTTGASDPDVFVAAWTVLVKLKPRLDTSFAKQLITVVAFFGVSRNFETNLTQNESSKFFADFESTD
jgi:hypothetical protein